MKETKKFETESKQLLSLMINSIYSNNEIFLRELISNASDAIDKYHYLSLTDSEHHPLRNHEIYIALDKKKRTISISDNGIGMDKKDLENNLGTIAKSGSKEFIKKLKENKDDINIIGQFGVGFYSAFMVANKIEVLTKKEGGNAYLFTSNGEDSYTIEDAEKAEGGTTITIYLKKNKDEVEYDKYLEEYEISSLVKKYSDYIRYPITMEVTKSKPKLDKDGKEIEGKTEEYKEKETLNSMIPLWKKNKADVSEEELNNFYKEKFNDYEDPLLSLFVKVDGTITYDSLLYIPSHQPYNLYSDSYEKGLQLYSKGIFIKDKAAELIPDYLKFVKGLVDSPDFNLNISREILQVTPMMKKVSENIEKKVIGKLKEVKDNEFEKYLKFWEAFGEHIKFGIYQSYGFKKDLLQDLLIFKSFKDENNKYISLKEYIDNKEKDQKYIYYASGENVEAIKNLPQMEKYKAKGIDVLLLDQKIDEFAIQMLREYDKTEFKNISDDSTNDVSEEEKNKIEEITSTNKRLLDNLKEGLKDNVTDVVISSKLVDSPVCLSTKDGLSLEMEKTLNEQPGLKEDIKAQKVLEINPNHPIFTALSSIQDNDEEVKEYASLLYDEALILEGREISDRGEFVKKLNNLFSKAISK
ncbi:MAG: molecular chaperone HtpG [Erysipelotrichaceae bacterium]|nr:molecular chaperone HtpG [Erysipelotrichaceae bacterium]